MTDPGPDSPAGPDVQRLARLHGIQPEYQDVWDRRHEVSEGTQRALLQAMGVDCSDAEAVRRSLDSGLEARRQRLLEPVLVVAKRSPLIIPLNGAAAGCRSVEWRVMEEEGSVHEGAATLAELPAAEGDAQRPREGWLALQLVVELPSGYHSFGLRAGERRAVMPLIVVPERCYLPRALAGRARWWGLGVQLYGMRRAGDWGIGDYSALPPLIRLCARQGGAMLGASPLHAMFPDRPEHASPYSPSSRLFLNVLFLDVERIPEVTESRAARTRLEDEEIRRRISTLQEGPLVDYTAVAELKRELLELAFAEFQARPGTSRYQAFRRFCQAEGDPLLRHALFEALQEHFHAQDPAIRGWRGWPRVYQDPASAAVGRFAADYADRVDLHRWLQWLAAEQLADAARQADAEDLAVGLYLDVAVSVDLEGAETWANQHLYALDATVGAPGDLHNPMGQDWGLPPMIPQALYESAYALFIETLSRNMRHAGAIRLDHVMSLMRLFWIPRGAPPETGAYVHYPLEDLLGIVALESQRNRCVVVGEDLGTVAEEFSAILSRLRILSYRVLYFEQDEERRFLPPDAYPRQALVAASTHDLPTLAGWWAGRDLEWRERLGLFPGPEEQRAARAEREQDRCGLLAALQAVEEVPEAPAKAELAVGVHRLLARTPAMLQLVQLEDALGLEEQANLPTVVDDHPNWRRRIPVNVEDLPAEPLLVDLLRAVAEERQRASGAEPAMTGAPRATYRLQLHRDFTFDDARELVPYLHALGISHAYASPYLKSRSGSVHGYDVIDHNAIDPEIGSRRAFADWTAALAEQGMSHVLDIVPNHMGVMGEDNAWWLDVLEHGEAARHARYFDIDWRPPERALAGKILLPVLGDFYGDALDRGELTLCFDRTAGGFAVRYHEHLFPVDPRGYPLVLDAQTAGAAEGQAETAELPDASRLQLASLSAAFSKLPRRSELGRDAVAERYRDSALLRQRLRELYRDDAAVAWRIDANVAALQGRELHELLERQAWRLAHWRTASDEINYRRFFDINDLAGLRTEESEVFEAIHRRILSLVGRGIVTGLRVDHPDGLYDPTGYFRRLAARCAEVRPARVPATYLVVEKILAVDEALPEDWSVSGTTGYEFASLVNGLFVDPAGEAGLTEAYARFVGERTDFAELIYRCKHLVMRQLLAAELRVLGNRLHRLAQADLHTRDYTLNHLTEALREVVACFPVYRTYIRGADVGAEDRKHVERAVAEARRRSDAVDTSVFGFIQDVLLQQRPGRPAYRRAMLDFAMKLQQYTAPVTAKGVEDTALYRYPRLLSLNDVGDDPGRFGVSPETFHRANAERLALWPYAMLGTSSHDSKRGEDVRARLNVLSELPDEWQARVARWRGSNRHLIRHLEGGPAPAPNDEYFIYQTLFGTWPGDDVDAAARSDYRDRVVAYMTKALREARDRSSWHAPDEAYEQAVTDFMTAILDPTQASEFLTDFGELTRRIAPVGFINGLAQTVLKLTVPGVPDIYQGSELWNFALVDPDNRRPVDYRHRRSLLEELGPADEVVAAERLLARMAEGLPKLYVIRQLLHLRSRRPAVFERGAYLPVECRGPLAERLCGFVRQDRQTTLVVVVPRLVVGLCGEGGQPPLGATWQDAVLALPEQPAAEPPLRNLFTGEQVAPAGELAAAEALARFPVAVLVGEREEQASETGAQT